MGDIVIRADGLSKQYLIGTELDGHKTLRETLTNGFVAPFRRTMKLLQGKASSAAELCEKIWALKDVSFEIKRGEVLGIIGRNGAGKTTLLKILSRITEPTAGYAEICGRVGSLLEVGTGFHPELTGRENIYLNGAILGMKKEEIRCKFDEIVTFAEIGKFLDTPVKHYSSGMYVRLAFAVAAHLEPEILMVDEVLAVGDAAFQKKCLGKLEGVSEAGKTVLFVSHNMVAVQRFCTRVILLAEGKIVLDGEPNMVVEKYLADHLDSWQQQEIAQVPRGPGLGDHIRIIRCSLFNSEGQATSVLKFGEPFQLELEVVSVSSGGVEDLSVVVGVDSIVSLERIATCASEESGLLFKITEQQSLHLSLHFEDLLLSPGRYYLTIAVRTGRYTVLDRVPQCLRFEILETPYPEKALQTFLAGYLRLQPEWFEVSSDKDPNQKDRAQIN